MEDALKRLDKLTQEEARMAAAEILRLTHIVDNKMTTVIISKRYVSNSGYLSLNARMLGR
jgi:hypothetical protein